jgi:hypothetical protein
MSEDIKIGDDCLLQVVDDDLYFIDNGRDEHATLNDAEFNALASHAPLVQRLIEYARMNYQSDERDYSIYEFRQKLLTEIAELEKPA